MSGHWHNVYVREDVQTAFGWLRSLNVVSLGVVVTYDRNPADPENANGYVKTVDDADLMIISSCARWRQHPVVGRDVPKDAGACLQIDSTHSLFVWMVHLVRSRE